MYRGEIYLVDFGDVTNHEVGGMRPALVIQNNVGNKHSPTTIVAPISTSKRHEYLPTRVVVNGYGLRLQSNIVFEQIRTIDKTRIISFIGYIPPTVWEYGLKASLELL